MFIPKNRLSLPLTITLSGLLLLMLISGFLSTARANSLQTSSTTAKQSPNSKTATQIRQLDNYDASPNAATTYIVVLKDQPLANYKGGLAGLSPTAVEFNGRDKLNVASEASQDYLAYLDNVRAMTIQEANRQIGRSLHVTYQYGATIVGFAAQMTAAEAAQIEQLDNVLFVEQEKISYPMTDAGPAWSGADDLWGGTWNALSFVAEINGANEVPPVTTNVAGTAEFTYNFYTNELAYTIDISNPNNVNLVSMHIHAGAAGANGAIIHDFMLAPTTGSISRSDTIVLSDVNEAALVNTGLYINVHNSTSGEARGQIELNGTLGEGVIVGIIDTGVDPWNPSFAAVGGDGYVHTNPKGNGNYLGVCDPTNNGGGGIVAYDPTFPCNDKLIGVWGYTASNSSPRDKDGHGSHTASTAAGNIVFDAEALAPTQVFTADISGVAPHANLIVYDGCIDGGGCPGSSLAAAREQALLDGVDVINYSIGSTAPTGNPWSDAESLQWLALRDAGVFVATSNGNSGPGEATTGSPADLPWITSVGASSHNRAFLNTILLDDGNSTIMVEGQAMTKDFGPAEVVFAEDYGTMNNEARLCGPAAFTPGTFNGEMVVCERGIYGRVAKGEAVLAAGAGGFILAQPDEFGGGPGSVAADTHVLPAVHIDYYEYQILRQFVLTDSVGTVNGTISGATLDFDDAHGDIMADFSSRGPNGTDADLIVPKVTAPGRAIWAAYHQGVGGDGDYTYNVIQGTSMASPHTAGAGALLTAAHPDWTPAEMESALMLTARNTVLNDDGTNIATPFAQGAGHIAVGMAAASPLVMDVTTAEYEAADPATADDFDVHDLNIASLGEDDCLGTCSWVRTVKNVSSETLTWNVTFSLPMTATGSVSPATFTLAPGATQDLEIDVNISGYQPDTGWVFGSVILDEDSGDYPDGHMPIAVYPSPGSLPETLEISTYFTAGSEDIEDIVTIEITDLYSEVTGLVIADLTATSLPQDNDNSADFPAIFFDDVSTTFFYTLTVPADSFSVIAEIATTTSPDLDMLLFYDDDNNGIPELTDVDDPDLDPLSCQSAAGGSEEFCEILAPTAGTYFVAIINFESSTVSGSDDITLATAVVPNDADAGNLSVTGPTAVDAATPYSLTVHYDEPAMTAGDKLYGAIFLGSSPANLGNVGTVRVYLDYLGDPPVIVLDTAAISVTQSGGNVSTETLTISNEGAAPLSWDATQGLAFIADGSFEEGSGWESDGDFGGAICSPTTCGFALARTGDWWAWFGGWGSTNTSYVRQTVTIPAASSASLQFWLQIDASTNDQALLEVLVDNQTVASYTVADDRSDFTTYALASADLSAYADGDEHEITIRGTEIGSTVSGFFVDDVALVIPDAACKVAGDIPWLTLNPDSGSINAGDSQTVDVVFDATGLTSGVYSETVCISSNDPLTPITTVTVEMTVRSVIYMPIMRNK